MKTEYIESEIITDNIAHIKYATNINYTNLFNQISLLFNEELLNNQSPVLLFSVINDNGQTIFQFDIVNSSYELDSEKYDEKAINLIKDISKINKKDLIVKNNLIQKIPSISNFLQKKTLKQKIVLEACFIIVKNPNNYIFI